MAINIMIPTALRVFAGGVDTVAVSAATVGEALEDVVDTVKAVGKVFGEKADEILEDAVEKVEEVVEVLSKEKKKAPKQKKEAPAAEAPVAETPAETTEAPADTVETDKKDA